ncbi:MAG: linear amide C-N hydrolase [Proteobacteria bacterium]|nr:linear amide C-N hydrolase [Pseudomonadota bacterium]
MLNVNFKSALSCLLFLNTAASACTAFLLHREKEKLVGKSYDWNHESALLITNKKGVSKKGFSPVFWESGPQWISKYGSITFNQYGREFPNGGMNEEGLVVEVLWLSSSEYEAFDSRPVLNQLTWVQYQLDNFASVSEVIEALPKHRLSPIQGKIHYFVCDKSAQCAVVEWQKGKPVVHFGENLNPPVITNHTFEESLAALQNSDALSNDASIEESSLHRFVRAAKLVKETEVSVSGGFSILNAVAMKGLTTWNIVYDLENLTINYRTRKNPTIRSVNLRQHDFSCSTTTLMLNIHEGQKNVDNLWVGYSAEANERTIQESLNDVTFGWVLLRMLSQYPETTTCQ